MCAFNICLGNLSLWTAFKRPVPGPSFAPEFVFGETHVLNELDLIDNAAKPLLWWQQTLSVQLCVVVVQHNRGCSCGCGL